MLMLFVLVFADLAPREKSDNVLLAECATDYTACIEGGEPNNRTKLPPRVKESLYKKIVTSQLLASDVKAKHLEVDVGYEKGLVMAKLLSWLGR